MKGNPRVKVRYLVCFATWASLLVLYMHRSNISVSVLTMIAPEVKKTTSPCIMKNGSSKTQQPPIPVAFSWSSKYIGTVLGCFFYGYACTHLIGGILSARIGARKTMAITLFGSSIAQIISVPMASVGLESFIFCRILSGLSSGPIIPIIHGVVSVWSPPSELTTLAVFTHTGNVFGLIVNYGIGGFIAESSPDGWGIFLYICGGLGLLVLLMWFALGFDDPKSHPYISDEEYTQITGNSRSSEDVLKGNSHIGFKEVPFVEIFKSVPAWTCHFGQMANNFLLYGLLTGHPKFLKDVYGFSPKKASTLSMIPFIVSFIVQMVYSRLIDYLIKRKPHTKTRLRKISSFIGFVASGVFISVVGFVDCSNPYVAVVIVSFSMACYGANTSGYFTSIIELAPAYAPVVMGISNTLGSVSGIANPEIVNFIVRNSPDDRIGWRNAFIATGVITIATGIPYLLFGSSELQPWAYHDLAAMKEKDQALEMNSNTREQQIPQPTVEAHS